MSHTPFIVASFTIAAVLLAWCAFAPILQGRNLKQAILRRIKQTGNDDASNT
jgi:heme exporter protein CcmD